LPPFAPLLTCPNTNTFKFRTIRKNGNLEDEVQIISLKKKADLSALWGDDKLADVVVQLVLSGGAGVEKAETHLIAVGSTSTDPGDDAIIMESMQLHGAVLASRSPYYLRALTSGFRESTDKTIVRNLEDEKALPDMKLLLKLTYTASYTQVDEHPLDKPQLLRLLLLADGFEMTDCVAVWGSVRC